MNNQSQHDKRRETFSFLTDFTNIKKESRQFDDPCTISENNKIVAE